MLEKLNPEKLSIEFREGVTANSPLLGRKYTLTHSDITGDLFLTIGLNYALDKINKMRDEVLGEWNRKNNRYVLNIYVYLDGKFGLINAAVRNFIFRKELPLALEAIVYGDRELLNFNKELYNSNIIVHFISTIPYYNKVEVWGKVEDYK